MDSGGLYGGICAPSTSPGFYISLQLFMLLPRELTVFAKTQVYMGWKTLPQVEGKAGQLLFLTRSLSLSEQNTPAGMGVGVSSPC